MDGLAVRRIGAEEAARAAPAFDRYRRFYEQESDLAGAESFLRARLAGGQSEVFLAEDGEGAVLGLAQVYPTFSSVRAKPVAVLNDLFVEEHARRRGVARALIEAVEASARQTGKAALSLSTARDNHSAQALYRAMGWIEGDRFVTYNRNLDD